MDKRFNETKPTKSVKLNLRKPKEVGVVISFDLRNNIIEKFGFESETEVLDYIKENLDDGTFFIYAYEKDEKDKKIKIMMPFLFGDKEDLDG